MTESSGTRVTVQLRARHTALVPGRLLFADISQPHAASLPASHPTGRTRWENLLLTHNGTILSADDQAANLRFSSHSSDSFPAFTFARIIRADHARRRAAVRRQNIVIVVGKKITTTSPAFSVCDILIDSAATRRNYWPYTRNVRKKN